MPLNMKKQWRAELRILERASVKIAKDCVAELNRIDRERDKLDRVQNRVLRTVGRTDKKLSRRIAILEGRLSQTLNPQPSTKNRL